MSLLEQFLAGEALGIHFFGLGVLTFSLVLGGFHLYLLWRKPRQKSPTPLPR